MNAILWIVQVLLALHTLMGAVWKLSHPVERMGSLAAIPQAVWTAMSGVEVLCAIGLVLPVLGARFKKAPAIAAAVIAAEMLMMVAVHFASGATEHGEAIYWLVVTAICAIVIFGRGLSSRGASSASPSQPA